MITEKLKVLHLKKFVKKYVTKCILLLRLLQEIWLSLKKNFINLFWFRYLNCHAQERWDVRTRPVFIGQVVSRFTSQLNVFVSEIVVA